MEKSEPASGPAPSPRRLPQRRRIIGTRLFVLVAVFLSLILALAMVASLYLHWRRGREPSTYIIVIGDATWKGAEVVVTPENASPPGGQRVQVVLDERNAYQTPVFELPGRYLVTVSVHEQVTRRYPVEVDATRGMLIDLPTLVDVIGDSSMNGGRVLLSSKDDSQTAVLNDDNRFRVSFRVPGGEYSLEVQRNNQLLDHAEFFVTPHIPKTVDFRRGS